MAKLVLQPAPTFKAKVSIPVPGTAGTDVEFTFKHRDRDQLKTYMEELRELDKEISVANDVKVVQLVASGWENDEPFDTENIERMVRNYHSAANAVALAYVTELVKAKAGN